MIIISRTLKSTFIGAAFLSGFVINAHGSTIKKRDRIHGDTPKVLLAQNTDTSKVAQVKAGTLKTANASWWGFDKEDSTDALQDAINSKVPTLIVDNMNSPWIVAKTINLTSDQKIIFERGVTVEAMKDKFKGVGDCLF